MAFETKGIVKRIGTTQQVSEKFSKRTIVIDVEDGKFPQVCEFQATGDRCALLDEVKAGDQVSIAWNLRGREWTGKDNVVKVFNSCDIWKIERIGAAQSRGGSHEPAPSSSGGYGGEPDGLPF